MEEGQEEERAQDTESCDAKLRLRQESLLSTEMTWGDLCFRMIGTKGDGGELGGRDTREEAGSPRGKGLEWWEQR